MSRTNDDTGSGSESPSTPSATAILSLSPQPDMPGLISPPPISSSPPPAQPQYKLLASSMNGPPRLMALQEPQENFHKDEGGKANQLSFRVILQGELPPEVLANAVDGCLPLSVRPVFDDGELADPSVLDVVGGTDGTNPCIQLRSRLGGVRYRLRTVSKRLGNRGIGVILYVVGCPSIEPIRSESTMVFSKRKNKEQRLEEQARERHELLERQRAAQLLLSARASPSAEAISLSNPTTQDSGVAGSVTASPAAPTATLGLPAGQALSSTNSAPNLKFPGTNTTNTVAGLPPQFIPAAPAIVRPRPRRPSRDKDQDSDSDSYDDESATSKRRKVKHSNSSMASVPPSNQRHSKSLEERVAKLESLLENNMKEVEEMRAAMNLCFYQLSGANVAGLRRSSSQNVPWDFSDPVTTFDTGASVRDQLVGGLTMVSPQPLRSPFEIDSWVNGNNSLVAPDPQGLKLRRDISTGSVSHIQSPRSNSAIGLPPMLAPKRSPSSESLS